jgi:hypothetical protein
MLMISRMDLFHFWTNVHLSLFVAEVVSLYTSMRYACYMGPDSSVRTVSLGAACHRRIGRLVGLASGPQIENRFCHDPEVCLPRFLFRNDIIGLHT